MSFQEFWDNCGWDGKTLNPLESKLACHLSWANATAAERESPLKPKPPDEVMEAIKRCGLPAYSRTWVDFDNASIEFVQDLWIISNYFAGLTGESQV